MQQLRSCLRDTTDSGVNEKNGFLVNAGNGFPNVVPRMKAHLMIVYFNAYSVLEMFYKLSHFHTLF